MARLRAIPGPEDLCLAFANTLAWRGTPAPVESLGDAGALVDWAARHWPGPGALPGALRRHLPAAPAAAAALHGAALALREALYRSFAATARGGRPAGRDLALINRALAAAPARTRLSAADAGCAWLVPEPRGALPGLLAPVLWSAGDLLAGAARLPVRCCANDACRWLFVDRSKGATRRWCDMASCGNRAKARRHYQRTKRAADAARHEPRHGGAPKSPLARRG